VNADVVRSQFGCDFLWPAEQALHLSRVLAVSDQDRVLARHNDKILHAKQRDKGILGNRKRILRVDENRLALCGVGFVLRPCQTACLEPTSDQPHDRRVQLFAKSAHG